MGGGKCERTNIITLVSCKIYLIQKQKPEGETNRRKLNIREQPKKTTRGRKRYKKGEGICETEK